MLKLMYITNNPKVALIAENAGVDRIFVDMEYIGKSERQGGLDTVQSHHTIQDIKNIRNVIEKADLMVRCNPMHRETKDYCSSKEEIENAIEAGADILMLPFFKTVGEVEKFINHVNGRAKVFPLVETPEAVEHIDEILKLDGIDEIYIGLNDLSLGYGKKFMFELLADGTVEKLCEKFKEKEIPYGFGGIASIGKGQLPSEKIIKEHYRLGSTIVILSRSFCNTNKTTDLDEIQKLFKKGITDIRAVENECVNEIGDFFVNNKDEVIQKVKMICESLS